MRYLNESKKQCSVKIEEVKASDLITYKLLECYSTVPRGILHR